MSSFAPRISIVTPSFNQARYLETTIRSVLDQNYPNLEFIIMDGGSTDGSVEIIKKYADRLTYWVSGQDRGQFHAITEGFKHATGDVFAYLNSDDIYFPWTLSLVGEIFSQVPEVHWLTPRTTVVIDAEGDPLTVNEAIEHTRLRFFSGMTLGDFFGQSGWIQQEGTFWRRELWEKAGARMDESQYRIGDFELWARFWQYGELTTTWIPLAAFRLHGSNKSIDLDVSIRESRALIARYPHERKYSLRQFRFLRWLHKHTGRLHRRFGSQQRVVDYDLKTGTWLTYASHVI